MASVRRGDVPRDGVKASESLISPSWKVSGKRPAGAVCHGSKSHSGRFFGLAGRLGPRRTTASHMCREPSGTRQCRRRTMGQPLRGLDRLVGGVLSCVCIPRGPSQGLRIPAGINVGGPPDCVRTAFLPGAFSRHVRGVVPAWVPESEEPVHEEA